MKTILALDQSSKTTGYAVFKDGILNAHGKFTFNDSDVNIRLMKIREYLIELINKYQPTFVIIEDIQLQDNVKNNVQTFKILAEVYGVILELLTELNIPYTSVLATTWKPKLGIKDRYRVEQKKHAQKYIQDKYNIKATEDECDAICIGTYYLQELTCPWTN